MSLHRSVRAAALAVLWLLTMVAVEAAVTIPPYMIAPAGSVNTNLIGFKVKTFQTDVLEPNDGNNDIYTEALLLGIAFDRNNGNAQTPVPNLADLTTAGGVDANGYFTETNQISYERGLAPRAGFASAQFPGIPGTGGSFERFACEALTYLYLPAGTNHFVVNTDDDFKMTVGVRNNPYDAFRVQAGIFQGGRGAADTAFDVIVQQAGFYPARCTFDQGTGGANWQWYTRVNGVGILVNDTTNPNAILAYQLSPPGAGTFSAPYAVSVTPTPGSNAAEPNLVQIVMADGSVAFDKASVVLSVDGTVVTPTITQSGTNTTIAYVPSPIFTPGSPHNISFAFKDKATPANSYTNTFAFTVINYGVIPSGFAAPAGGVDKTKGGFNVKTFVADLAYGLANSNVRAESQVDGILGNFLFNTNWANVAVPGPNPDGSYTETQWINYNIVHDGTGEAGNFRAPNFPDAGFPGIPGNAVVHANGTDNSAAEVTAFLDLKAGLYQMIVNSDDGFRVTAGPNYRDALAIDLGEFDGGRGANDTPFDFVVQSDGVYPFRLIWENGGGGANLEWLFRDLATGNKVLINNLTNAGAVIKAYYGGTGRAWISSVSPYVNGRDIAPTAPIQLSITDGGTTVDPTKVKLNLDGADVTPSSTKSGSITTVKFTPANPLAMGPHTAIVTYTESDGTTRTGSWSFSVQGPFTPGFVRQDFYGDGGGNELRVLLRTDPPTFTHYLTTWATPDDEQGDNYTERLFSWFAPDETTDYVFFMSSDDNSHLFISPDRNPANYAFLANEPRWNNSRNWVNTDRRDGTNPENRTDLNNISPGPLHLVKGQKYFLITSHQEGGGGDHVDLLVMKAADVTAPAGGGSGEPVNGEPASGGPRFGLFELFPPVIVSETPRPGQNSSLQPNLHIVLASGSFPLDVSSIQLSFNGANVTAASTITATTNPPGADVVYSYPVLPPGTNSVQLIVADKASPPNVLTNQYTFITQPLNSLDINLGTLPGSGDATKPGFRYRVVQTGTGNENSNAQAEIELAGGEAPNIASDFGAGTDGYLAWTNVVNFNISSSTSGGGDIGNFQGPNYPDFLFPGLPGTTGSTDSPAAEWLTYVEFPTAGYYGMGVNSDDGFRVSSATNQDYPVNLVTIKSPANLAQNLLGIEATFAPALPQLATVGPITANVVAADPPDAVITGPLNNAAAMKGNIALIDRGTTTFADKISHAQSAGAIGVIIADQQTDPQRIITMGGGLTGLNIPAVEINYASGQILHTALAGGTTVNASMQSHAFTDLGAFNGGRGAADTLFAFTVPAAGVYPMRLVWENGTGGSNVEWFMVDRNNNKVLLNDPANVASGLKAFRARDASKKIPPPVTNPTLKFSLSGTTLTFTWTGTGVKLQSTAKLGGTWADVTGGTSSGATANVSGKTTQFFRLAPQ